MQNIRDFFASIRAKQEGATAVEYGIMVALIAAVIIAAVVVVGNQTDAAFDCVGQSLAERGEADVCTGTE